MLLIIIFTPIKRKTIKCQLFFFSLSDFEMSEEIKDNEGVQFDDIINQEDEPSEEIIEKVSINDEEENEPTLNGHETPSATSFTDVIIEKQDEPLPISDENHTPQLLQIISDKSNKEASSAILNTVKKRYSFFLPIY
jgi:hypothetical protein